MAAFLFGICGIIASVVLVGMWDGVALMFNFAMASPDQFRGLALLLGCGGFASGAVLSVVFN